MSFKILKISEIKKPHRFVYRLFLHCSASNSDGANYTAHGLSETINRWHADKGWSGIGYHWTIDKEGNLMSGRHVEYTPAAQFGHNRDTLAVCVHGLDKDKFTDEQMNTVKQLCDHINSWNADITFHGHCEVSNKTCPVFDYKTLLNLDSKGNFNAKQ